ncbi:MAG: hypothetical protein FWE48_05085 [Coriobacteriia bacterium]|nr:hypothetical protein [Coriobacteriia bacterium]MCL2870688.1 hypothetical protein [Coriobacteriia bacterium]
MLTERRRIVLRAVVDHHVASAAPVGSSILAQRYVMNTSPATIRSELGALEDSALLYQPHTSAGRVPTHAGYRRVVDDILSRPVLSAAASLRNAEAAYPHRKLHLALRKSNSNGSLMLAELFRSVVMHLAAATSSLALLSVTLSRGTSSRFGVGQLYYNGLANLLMQPEFTKSGGQEGFAHLVGMLENERALNEVLVACSYDDRVTVSIGSENCTTGLDELSLVTHRYTGGVIAVIGPTRMNYREAIAAVSTAAHTLDDILE